MREECKQNHVYQAELQHKGELTILSVQEMVL
jgi:hypothetical protein